MVLPPTRSEGATVRSSHEERKALPVTSDEKGALSIARRRKRQRRPSWQAQWAIPSRRAHQGRDCGAAEIWRIVENAPGWPDLNRQSRLRSPAISRPLGPSLDRARRTYSPIGMAPMSCSRRGVLSIFCHDCRPNVPIKEWGIAAWAASALRPLSTSCGHTWSSRHEPSCVHGTHTGPQRPRAPLRCGWADL